MKLRLLFFIWLFLCLLQTQIIYGLALSSLFKNDFDYSSKNSRMFLGDILNHKKRKREDGEKDKSKKRKTFSNNNNSSSSNYDFDNKILPIETINNIINNIENKKEHLPLELLHKIRNIKNKVLNENDIKFIILFIRKEYIDKILNDYNKGCKLYNHFRFLILTLEKKLCNNNIYKNEIDLLKKHIFYFFEQSILKKQCNISGFSSNNKIDDSILQDAIKFSLDSKRYDLFLKFCLNLSDRYIKQSKENQAIDLQYRCFKELVINQNTEKEIIILYNKIKSSLKILKSYEDFTDKVENFLFQRQSLYKYIAYKFLYPDMIEIYFKNNNLLKLKEIEKKLFDSILLNNGKNILRDQAFATVMGRIFSLKGDVQGAEKSYETLSHIGLLRNITSYNNQSENIQKYIIPRLTELKNKYIEQKDYDKLHDLFFVLQNLYCELGNIKERKKIIQEEYNILKKTNCDILFYECIKNLVDFYVETRNYLIADNFYKEMINRLNCKQNINMNFIIEIFFKRIKLFQNSNLPNLCYPIFKYLLQYENINKYAVFIYSAFNVFIKHNRLRNILLPQIINLLSSKQYEEILRKDIKDCDNIAKNIAYDIWRLEYNSTTWDEIKHKYINYLRQESSLNNLLYPFQFGINFTKNTDISIEKLKSYSAIIFFILANEFKKEFNIKSYNIIKEGIINILLDTNIKELYKNVNVGGTYGKLFMQSKLYNTQSLLYLIGHEITHRIFNKQILYHFRNKDNINKNELNTLNECIADIGGFFILELLSDKFDHISIEIIYSLLENFNSPNCKQHFNARYSILTYYKLLNQGHISEKNFKSIFNILNSDSTINAIKNKGYLEIIPLADNSGTFLKKNEYNFVKLNPSIDSFQQIGGFIGIDVKNLYNIIQKNKREKFSWGIWMRALLSETYNSIYSRNTFLSLFCKSLYKAYHIEFDYDIITRNNYSTFADISNIKVFKKFKEDLDDDCIDEILSYNS